MKRTIKILSVIILLSVLLLTACKPVTPQTYTDSLQREVTLLQPAQKIVSLAPSNTELLFAIGAGSQVVGRDDFSDYPAEAAQLPSVGGSMGDYNLEAIVALQPDLVLLSELNSSDLVQSLENLGLKVYYLGNPVEIEGLYTNLENLGKITGHEADAASLIESLKAKVSKVDELIATTSTRPLVFYELDATEPTKPWTAGPGTFVDQLITRAGGENLGGSLDGAWVQISQEALIINDPEIIVMGDSIYGITAEQVAERAGWENLKAVTDGQIYPFDDDLVSRPGPRLVDGLIELARIIHPEIADQLPK
ncbi:MAG: cobalamin-binding protein [Anaerolineaceae bacterium]